MNGLDSDADLNFLKGRSLERICMGVFQLKLDFEPDVVIDIQGAVQFVDPAGVESRFDYAVGAVALMHQLIPQSVASVSWATDGTLSLGFEYGQKLILLDERKMYEAYQIYYGDLSIIV